MSKYYVIDNGDNKFEGMTKEQILAAIKQAIETGQIQNIDTGFITTIQEINHNKGLRFWLGTMAEYEALPTKAEDVHYIFTDDTRFQDLYNEIERDFGATIKLVKEQTQEVVNNDKEQEKKLQELNSKVVNTYTKAEVYTRAETDSKLAGKVNTSQLNNYYIKSEVDNKLNIKANKDDVYTRSEVNTKLDTKANASNVYTKSETDTKLNTKANASNVYTKSESDTKYATNTKVDNINSTLTSEINEIKKDRDTNIVAEVICSHQYEVTGNTGDEHGLAIEDQQMLIRKIEGQSIIKDNTFIHSKCDLISTGRNLLNKSLLKFNYAINSNNGDFINYNNYYALEEYIPIIGGKEYYFENCNVYSYDVNKKYIRGEGTGIVTVISNASYIRVEYNTNNISLSDNIGVYLNSTYKENEPYKEEKISNIGKLKAFDYIESGKLIKQTSYEKTLNGVGDWVVYGVEGENTIFKLDTSNWVKADFKTNKFGSFVANYEINDNNDFIDFTGNMSIRFSNGGSSVFYFICKTSLISSVTALKDYLRNNPIKMLYKLETPTIEEVSIPSGYAVYNGGLQIQDGTLPYRLTKQYNLSTKAQILANIEVDREQQNSIKDLDGDIKYLNNYIKKVENNINLWSGDILPVDGKFPIPSPGLYLFMAQHKSVKYQEQENIILSISKEQYNAPNIINGPLTQKSKGPIEINGTIMDSYIELKFDTTTKEVLMYYFTNYNADLKLLKAKLLYRYDD